MTTHWCDFQNTDVILHCGSNSVENHPVSSLWLGKAHDRGAKWIVDEMKLVGGPKAVAARAE